MCYYKANGELGGRMVANLKKRAPLFLLARALSRQLEVYTFFYGVFHFSLIGLEDFGLGIPRIIFHSGWFFL